MCECADYNAKSREAERTSGTGPLTGMDQWRDSESSARATDTAARYPDGLDPEVSPAALPETMQRVAASKDPKSCKATIMQVTDEWCGFICATEKCPADMCKCADTLEATREEPERAAKKGRKKQDLDPYWNAPASAKDPVPAGLTEAPKQALDVGVPAGLPDPPAMALDPYWADPAPAASADEPADELAARYADEPAAAASLKPVAPHQTTDDSCKSLVLSTNDFWCATQCANDKSTVTCPPDICSCGPVQQEDNKALEAQRASADTLPSAPSA